MRDGLRAQLVSVTGFTVCNDTTRISIGFNWYRCQWILPSSQSPTWKLMLHYNTKWKLFKHSKFPIYGYLKCQFTKVTQCIHRFTSFKIAGLWLLKWLAPHWEVILIPYFFTWNIFFRLLFWSKNSLSIPLVTHWTLLQEISWRSTYLNSVH